jgi:hypothetical protein
MYDEEYKPISPFGYLGYELLFAIPVIGWVIQLIFSICHKNRNVKNFARSFYCLYLLSIVISLILAFVIIKMD